MANRGNENTKGRHTISLLVENKFGALTRIAGLFSGRGFNIDSLTVAPTVDPTISRMTIVTRDNGQIIEQILKQLRKLIDVIKVVDLCEEDYIEREMALIKVKAEPESRAEILRIADIFRGKIVDVSATTYTLEITGDDEKLEAMINLLKPLGIIEIARTGKVALGRANKVLRL